MNHKAVLLRYGVFEDAKDIEFRTQPLPLGRREWIAAGVLYGLGGCERVAVRFAEWIGLWIRKGITLSLVVLSGD